MCTGRVDLSFPLRALLGGADGVFIGGCWLGECHYLTDGNYDALGNMYLLKKLMLRIGIDPRRLRIDWIAASQGTRFAEIMDEFAGEIHALGPQGTGEGIDPATLKPKLEALSRMVPQLKVLVRERLQVKVKSADAYEKLYANPKVDAWIDELLADPLAAEALPGYYIDPDQCVGCLLCFKKCPTHAIQGDNKVIHVIDQDRCTHCGTCYYVCPERIHAVKRIAADAIPAPLAPDQRVIAKQAPKSA